MTPSDTDELHRAFVDGGIVLDEPAAQDPSLTGLHITITGGHWFSNEFFEVGPIHKPAEIEALVSGIRWSKANASGMTLSADEVSALDAALASFKSKRTEDEIFMAGFDAGMNRARDGAEASHKRIKDLEMALAAAANELASKSMHVAATRAALVAAGVTETHGEPK